MMGPVKVTGFQFVQVFLFIRMGVKISILYMLELKMKSPFFLKILILGIKFYIDRFFFLSFPHLYKHTLIKTLI